MAPQWCTKFRVFNVLLLLCVLNALLFRSYFGSGLQTLLWTRGNRTAPRVTATSLLNTTVVTHSSSSSSSVTNTSLHGGSSPTAAGQAVTEGVKDGVKEGVKEGVTEALAPVAGPGAPMEAWGKLVKPLANVAAPWRPDNTSTLCPLVPPNLGE